MCDLIAHYLIAKEHTDLLRKIIRISRLYEHAVLPIHEELAHCS